MDDAISRALFNNPEIASKKKIYNKVRSSFGPNTLERLKHKKFGTELGHLKLDVEESTGSVKNKNITTILVTGNNGNMRSVNRSVHAEQKLIAAVNRIEGIKSLSIQEVWVAGCKRACNLCHTELTKFRTLKSRSFEFEFESPLLAECQGSQRTTRYD